MKHRICPLIIYSAWPAARRSKSTECVRFINNQSRLMCNLRGPEAVEVAVSSFNERLIVH